jgi:feruloyl esterase
MGAAAVDKSVRFYEVPGFGHAMSNTFNLGWDQLAALENWVEQGIDPANNQIASDSAGVPGRTRPLCRFPTWPKYQGRGDINQASSFKCVSP